jgi:hypothetical protein
MSTATPTEARAPDRYLRWALLLAAGIATLSALTDLPAVFAVDYQQPTALLRFAQALLAVKLLIAPFVAGFAFYCALKRRLRAATLALAALLLLTWLLDDATSIAIHGPALALSFDGILIGARQFAYPLFALAGGWLAYRDRRPGLAGLLVCLPWVITWVGFVNFSVAVLLNGF